jgi:hypothetical protein
VVVGVELDEQVDRWCDRVYGLVRLDLVEVE